MNMNSQTFQVGTRTYTFDEIVDIGRLAGIDLRREIEDDIDPFPYEETLPGGIEAQFEVVQAIFTIHPQWADSELARIWDMANNPDMFQYIIWLDKYHHSDGEISAETMADFALTASNVLNHEVEPGFIFYEKWIEAVGLKNRRRNYNLFGEWLKGLALQGLRERWPHERLAALFCENNPVENGQLIVPFRVGNSKKGIMYDFVTYVAKVNDQFLPISDVMAKGIVHRETIYALILKRHYTQESFSSECRYFLRPIANDHNLSR